MSTFQQGFEFDQMAMRPMYQVCPRWLIDHCSVTPDSTVVDLGCGSGILTQLLLDQFRDASNFRVFAVDPSEWELKIARSRISDSRATFIAGRAQEIGVLVNDVDAVLLCNVLHQIPRDERSLVCEGAFGLLREGGKFGANTLFYDGGIDSETRKFYAVWMLEAWKWLARASVKCTPPKDTPVALQLLTPQHHQEMLQSAGFSDVMIEEINCEWTVEDWEALSRYSVFIQGALAPEIDLEIGSKALIHGVRSAYQIFGYTTVPRRWLHCAARRP